MLAKGLTTIASGIVVLSLTACGTTTPNYPTTTSPQATYPASGTSGPNVMAGYGVVQGIDLVPRESAAAGIGVGTVAGAVVGGALGSQVGSGRGRTAATVAGAAGGALAGRAMEGSAQPQGHVYRLTLRMDDGTVQSLVQESQPSLRIGDRIRIGSNGVVERL